MFNEIIRISGGKPLELEIGLSAYIGILDLPERKELPVYTCVMEKAALFLDYPNICTHFWNPTCKDRWIGPYPHQVRGRCRR
jgi:hypothetical protein